jgi:hypothetical protein
MARDCDDHPSLEVVMKELRCFRRDISPGRGLVYKTERIRPPTPLSTSIILFLSLALLPLLGLTLPVSECGACIQDVRVLLIGTTACGAECDMTKQVFLIQNYLEFNGIPYDLCDVVDGCLTQTRLDQYDGVIIEESAVYGEATPSERVLLADNMRNGNITALVSEINGRHTAMNGTIYGAMGVSVDGQGNSEGNISLGDSARIIYDYDGDHGFIICGGLDFSHVGMAVTPLGEWSYVGASYCGDRVYGMEVALGRWMKNTFGFDTRVTMPIISLYLSDTQTTMYPRSQALIDFMAGNKHRIRSSGFLTTNPSAFQTVDTTLQKDEIILSEWGSMVLHGKDHGTVGTEGEDRDFERQYTDMAAAVAFLGEHFTRYKPIKGPPNLSWNEETLHAMYLNGIPYLAATMKKDGYATLYRSVIDAENEFEREKIYLRGEWAGLRYYPFHHNDATGDAWIYAVDYYAGLNADMDPADMGSRLRQYALNWWTPVMVATHFSGPGDWTALGNPTGWMAVMDTVMDQVDYDTCPRRRWVDTHDYAKYIQRFDQELAVNSISIRDNTITYDLTANQPVKYLTLKADSTDLCVNSVTVKGISHNYFGPDYAHLPEIYGNTLIVANMGPEGNCEPHVAHISPNAVLEAAVYSNEKLTLTMTGDFEATVRVVGSHAAFGCGITTVHADGTEELYVDVSADTCVGQVDLELIPTAGAATAELTFWDSTNRTRREWLEYAEGDSIGVQHTVGGLAPNSVYMARHGSCPPETCISNDDGEITFFCFDTFTPCTMSVELDSSAAAIGLDDGPVARNPSRVFVKSHPNPSKHSAVISFGLRRPGPLTMALYSPDGRLVRRVLDETKPAGTHSVEWDGLDDGGRPVPPGVYFCRLKTADASETHKIILLR